MEEPVTAVEQTATESVLQHLLRDIVGGTYPAGSRLPAERELSKLYGTSRPTLREVLRRLGEWNLVEPRRGSGVVVCPWRDWSIEILPGYIKYGKPSAEQPTVARVLMDLLELRREIMVAMLRLVVPRMTPGATAGARAAMARAWAARHDARQFLLEDMFVMRALVESAKFVPALWLLNRLTSIYLDIARSFHAAFPAPDDYLTVFNACFDAIDAGKTEVAIAELSAYMLRIDSQVTRMLQGMA